VVVPLAGLAERLPALPENDLQHGQGADRTSHPAWRCGQHLIAAAGGAGRRSAKNADAPINQSREAHLPARPLRSPEGAMRRAVGQDPARYSR
jgi:hypothetical protein